MEVSVGTDLYIQASRVSQKRWYMKQKSVCEHSDELVQACLRSIGRALTFNRK